MTHLTPSAIMATIFAPIVGRPALQSVSKTQLEELTNRIRNKKMVTWPGEQFCAGHGFSYNPLADQAGAARVQPGNRYYCCEAVDWSEYCDTALVLG